MSYTLVTHVYINELSVKLEWGRHSLGTIRIILLVHETNDLENF